jgi:uncharacterized protein with FMN-binding domain/polyferredoxin
MATGTKDFMAHLLRLGACLLLIAAAAAGRGGRLLGRDLGRRADSAADTKAAVTTASDGATVIDTTSLAWDISGYGGPVPVAVTIRDGVVAEVRPVLPNDETPLFFGTLEESGLWKKWNGLPVEVAVTTRVDAVTGATYSSNAAIANVRTALATAASAQVLLEAAIGTPKARTVIAFLVILAAAVLPLVTRSRKVRTVLLALDIAVLGLWNGLFLSHARLIGWAGSGLRGTWADVGASLLLLVLAFLYPLFGRPQHYCLQVCPFGAAQELAGRIPARKWRLSPRLMRVLTAFRRLLWAALMLALWTGIWADWLDWELFAAFAWRAAPPLLLALAVAVLILAIFVPRPYCRFACPTGTLFKLAESNDKVNS